MYIDWDNVEYDEEGNIITPETEEASGESILDSDGKELVDGDSVFLIKDINVKGGKPLKRGTKFKNIRLNASAHESVECKDGKSLLCLRPDLVKKG